MAELYPDLKDRPIKDTIVLFDVDGTLTPARRAVTTEMLQLLSRLRQKVAIGYVSSKNSRGLFSSLRGLEGRMCNYVQAQIRQY